MATLNALKNLGKSIKADIVDATSGIAAKIEHARNERRVVSDFRALLREHPAAVTKAFSALVEPEKKPRKPRAAKQ